MSAVLSPPNGQLRFQFEYVPEFDSEFLSLFPHRGDFLWANHPAPKERPNWKTESRHLLSDRLIMQGEKLYGVRFAKHTRYVMLDIDPTSAYHPAKDEFAVRRILDALETIGLVTFVAVTSSYRGGIHLYLPFESPQPSWKIALVVSTLLQKAGFDLTPGQLELFPNARGYSEELKSLYSGHRLPLQHGSYLLNQGLEPTVGGETTFVQHWHHASQRNVLNSRKIQRIVKQAQTKWHRVSRSARKFLNDLNTDIESGWTGSGQTNYLLGRIAIREYVFRHVMSGGQPLAGETLAWAIADVARNLPGFAEFCNHKKDLKERSEEWARCVEVSERYWPYNGKALKQSSSNDGSDSSAPPSWNERQSQAARERIRLAVADLLEQGTLPAQATARRHAIRQNYGVGNTTLDKNRDLWHPDHLYAPEEPSQKTDSKQSETDNQPQTTSIKQYHPVVQPYPSSTKPNALFIRLYQPFIDNKLWFLFWLFDWVSGV